MLLRQMSGCQLTLTEHDRLAMMQADLLEGGESVNIKGSCSKVIASAMEVKV